MSENIASLSAMKNILTLMIMISYFFKFQASQEVSVLHVNTLITVVINDGPIKTTKKLTWEHVGRPIHLVVPLTLKASFSRKCRFYCLKIVFSFETQMEFPKFNNV